MRHGNFHACSVGKGTQMFFLWFSLFPRLWHVSVWLPQDGRKRLWQWLFIFLCENCRERGCVWKSECFFQLLQRCFNIAWCVAKNQFNVKHMVLIKNQISKFVLKRQNKSSCFSCVTEFAICMWQQCKVDQCQAESAQMWVKSHQDDTKEPEELTYNAQLNIAADELAEYAYDSCPPSQEKFPPFPTTIISLRIDGIRVTSKLKNQIEDAIHLESIRTYRSNKYGWDQQTWESVDWYAFETRPKTVPPSIHLRVATSGCPNKILSTQSEC